VRCPEIVFSVEKLTFCSVAAYIGQKRAMCRDGQRAFLGHHDQSYGSLSGNCWGSLANTHALCNAFLLLSQRGLLIRPYLTTLVEQVKPTFSPAASKLLSNKEFVTDTLVPLLAQENGRKLSEWVFMGDSDKESPPPLIGKWLEDVLLGKEDQIRTRGRFGRAKIIPPEPVGPRNTQQLGVPLEERQVPFRSDVLGLVPVDQWVEMAKAYLKSLRSYNQPLRSAESQQETSSMLSPGLFPDVSSVVTSTSVPTAVQPSQSASGLLVDGTRVEAHVGTRTLIGTIQGKEQGKYKFKPERLGTTVLVDYDKVKVIP
jgi:hypothetical protein